MGPFCRTSYHRVRLRRRLLDKSFSCAKALVKLSNKVGVNATTLFDRSAAHAGRCSANIFCSTKCWIEFAFDQTLRPTTSARRNNVAVFAALPTKLRPESSHVRASSQSRNAIFFLSLGF